MEQTKSSEKMSSEDRSVSKSHLTIDEVGAFAEKKIFEGLPHSSLQDGPDVYQQAAEVSCNEIARAKKKHGPRNFSSIHEGYGVLLEEVDEMWEEIKKDNIERAVEEAVQVAAMALRFVAEFGKYPFRPSKEEKREMTDQEIINQFGPNIALPYREPFIGDILDPERHEREESKRKYIESIPAPNIHCENDLLKTAIQVLQK